MYACMDYRMARGDNPVQSSALYHFQISQVSFHLHRRDGRDGSPAKNLDLGCMPGVSAALQRPPPPHV